jgi:hypothetical protein
MAHPFVNPQAKGVESISIPEPAPGKVGPLLFPCTSSRAESLSYVPFDKAGSKGLDIF